MRKVKISPRSSGWICVSLAGERNLAHKSKLLAGKFIHEQTTNNLSTERPVFSLVSWSVRSCRSINAHECSLNRRGRGEEGVCRDGFPDQLRVAKKRFL